MRQVVQFLEWRSKNWFAKVDSRTNATPVVRAGLSAYANKQGSVYHDLAVRFSRHWCSALASLSLPHAWATVFLEAQKEPLDNPDPKNRKQAEDPPVVHTHIAPPLPITTSTNVSPPLTTLETISHEAQLSDVDSDETLSEFDESGYESDSSWAE